MSLLPVMPALALGSSPCSTPMLEVGMKHLVATAAMAVVMLSPVALAQPGQNDVVVKWDTDYPKVVNGNLDMKGTVTFANGWYSANETVTITIAPTKGGRVNAYFANLPKNGGAWSKTGPLPGGAQTQYGITPSVAATKDGVNYYTIAGPQELRNLP